MPFANKKEQWINIKVLPSNINDINPKNVSRAHSPKLWIILRTDLRLGSIAGLFASPKMKIPTFRDLPFTSQEHVKHPPLLFFSYLTLYLIYSYYYTILGARETAFIQFFVLNSAETTPKTRVPRGSFF